MKTISHEKRSGVLAVAFSASFLMIGYELVRSASNTLFNADWGVAKLPIAMGFLPVFAVICLALYNRSLTWWGAQKTLFLTLLSTFWLFVLAFSFNFYQIKVGSLLLYYVRELYVIMLVEQFWSLINSSLSQNEAKSWNGWVLAISTVGGILGGLLVNRLAVDLGSRQLILPGALSLIPTAVCCRLAYHHLGEPKPRESKTDRVWFGLSQFREHPILWMILGVIFSSQMLSALVTLSFQNQLQLTIPEMDHQTAFSGLVFAGINALSIVMQLFSPWLLARVSMVSIQVVIPLVHLGISLVLVCFPGLTPATLGLLAFKSLDYSLFRASKEILYIPLPFAARYRAKEFIDVFCFRGGKGLAATFSLLAGMHGLMGLICGVAALWALVVHLTSRRLTT